LANKEGKDGLGGGSIKFDHQIGVSSFLGMYIPTCRYADGFTAFGVLKVPLLATSYDECSLWVVSSRLKPFRSIELWSKAAFWSLLTLLFLLLLAIRGVALHTGKAVSH
jgi:hypothetical protein